MKKATVLSAEVFLLCLMFFAGSVQGEQPLIISNEGGIPLILSAPHGGRLEIPGGVLRKGDGVDQFTTVRDVGVDIMALALADRFEAITGKRPFLVVAQFSRKYADVNREESDAVEDESSRRVYRSYHAALQIYCEQVQRRWGKGWLLDIHGQSVDSNAVFRGTSSGKSIQHFLKEQGAAAMTGPDGFQTELESAGWKIIPPLSQPELDRRTGFGVETKFNGGHITRTYAGLSWMDAMQFEFGSRYSSRGRMTNTVEVLAAVWVKHFLAPSNGGR
ncbi:MAG: N-formylglutamate amidohydrolase [Spirochaetes bacterium]|nr:N-formylglutamate amidohydrolase [Spirochaetota bacterium]